MSNSRDQVEADIKAAIERGDYNRAASLIVDNGRSSLDLKIMIRDAFLQIMAKEHRS